jgi:spermidine/putrescine transport system substrate-binding protein
MTRRHLPVLLLAVALLSPGCQKARPTLHLYTWADYVSPDLVKTFEADHQCQVVIDTFDSNEAMYAKLKAGASGYDLITPSSYMVSVMFREGLLQRIDHAQVPNLANVDPEYLKIAIDKAMDHSVPNLLTNRGIAYLKSKVADPPRSWAIFARSEYKGRMTMLNDMRETIGAALKSLGYSLNTRNDRELDEARDVVIRWKKNLAKFENEQYKTGLASGEFQVVHGYSGDILQVMAENKDIVFFVPEEGTSTACDDFVIPKTARETALAHAFINFIHRPDVAAANTMFVRYLCPNAKAYPLLDASIRDNPAIFMSPELRAKSEVIEDLGPDNAKYTKIWDQIKAAQ